MGGLTRSILIVLIAFMIFGSPFMGFVLNRTVGMAQPKVFLICLGLIVLGIAVFLFYSRRMEER